MITGNRIYKDRLFRFVFNDKKKLLSLYNALNHSHYEDEDKLEINTLEDFIYMGMKNDISFLLDSDMCLYEHQSTFNPNMPLRGLFYFSNLLQKHITENKYDIYKSTLVPLPTPKFVVFYNGNTNIPEQCVLKLSDTFTVKQKEKGCLEVETLILDINVGKNKQLMEGCKYLKDYSAFVDKVKKYRKNDTDLSTAIDNAIEYCIKHNIMKDVLEKHRSEVARLIFTEFDEVEFRQQQQKENEDLKEQIRLAKEEN
ncbi:MAG: hypothetical protein HFJ09_10665 [Lachnospiraceae bacterium]|nr:hypothetical protein [Lachnospiraceae bacterium]